MSDKTSNKRWRVWHIPQVPGEPFIVEVPDLGTASRVEGILAAYDEFQYEHKIKPDYANAGGIEVWDEKDQEWVSYDPNLED